MPPNQQRQSTEGQQPTQFKLFCNWKRWDPSAKGFLECPGDGQCEPILVPASDCLDADWDALMRCKAHRDRGRRQPEDVEDCRVCKVEGEQDGLVVEGCRQWVRGVEKHAVGAETRLHLVAECIAELLQLRLDLRSVVDLLADAETNGRQRVLAAAHQPQQQLSGWVDGRSWRPVGEQCTECVVA